MDPTFFYNLLLRVCMGLPIFSIPSIFIGVLLSKKSLSMDIFTYRSKLLRFILIIVVSSLVAYVIAMQLENTVTRSSISIVFTVYIPLVAYGFFANASAKRFVDMGRNKFFAMLLAVPMINLGVCYLLATSYTTKSD